MHRMIGFLSKRFVQIRPGEGRKVLLTFLYFFLIITAYYVIKPVSRSLVLGELGSRMVPYADLVCAILMGPIVTLFARLVDRLPKSTLVSGAFAVVIGVLLIFWKLTHWPLKWVAAAFYIWVAIFSVLIVTLFWLVANDLYRPREAKRLFGFIGSGGILGGIVGSSIAAVGAQVVGTEHLLLLSAGLLGGCWLVVRKLWALVPERTKEESVVRIPAAQTTMLSNVREFAKLLLASRYLLLLVTIVCVNKVVATLVYYQLNPFIEHAFPDPDARTTFMGMFLGGVNVAAFIVQFFFTSWILRRWGLRTALLVWPVSVLMGTTGLLFFPVFWLAAGTELCDASLNYSLQQTTKEVLYLPIDRSIRYKVKPFIDMVVFRFGKGFAALVGIVLLNVLHAPPRALGFVTIPLLAVWLAAAVWLRRDYITTIRTVLRARAASRRRPDGSKASPAPEAGAAAKPADHQDAWPVDATEPFGSLTDGRPSLRKLSLFKALVDMPGEPTSLAQELIADLTDYETHSAGSKTLKGEAPWLKTLIRDPNGSIATRRQAIRLLSQLEDQGTIDYLFAIVMLESDAVLRQEAVRGLVKLRLRGVPMDVSVSVVQRQIANEVANDQRIRRVISIYHRHHPGPPAANDPVLGLLRVLMEESVEQIFRLLMLVYRPEDIYLIYEQMRAAEVHVRTDAIELLDNLVSPAMRAVLLPILDEDKFLSLGGEGESDPRETAAAYQAIQEAIWDHNYWLSVTTLCVVGRLRLITLRQELERASRHRVPLISTAAKVALHLASWS